MVLVKKKILLYVLIARFFCSMQQFGNCEGSVKTVCFPPIFPERLFSTLVNCSQNDRKEDKMSRQLTCFIYEIGICTMVMGEDCRFDLKKTKVCEVEESSLTKTQIRAAIIAAGVKCPRGTEVYADKIARVRYEFTTEALKSIAEKRVELPLED